MRKTVTAITAQRPAMGRMMITANRDASTISPKVVRDRRPKLA
jgi:hypothetical protein